MNNSIDSIFCFLKDIAQHNNREWFAAHRDEYELARKEFENMVQKVILRTATFDESIKHLEVKDCTYRFYRDTRFSEDKSPYKNHLGAYLNAHGKKSCRSGYYMHIQPGNCFLAGGAICLPANVLKAIRQSVVDETDEFRSIVEEEQFKKTFPMIGESHLKTVPKGFSKEFPFLDYIRPKDYTVSHLVQDDFFRADDWLEQIERVFCLLKPYNDFINYTVDDYE